MRVNPLANIYGESKNVSQGVFLKSFGFVAGLFEEI
jgi:hypothetical protein